MMFGLSFRVATPADRAALGAMQARSMRRLGAGFYSQDVIEAFIAQIGTMDGYLIDDGTYLVGEVGQKIIASGGWTRRQATYDKQAGQAAEGAGRCATVRSLYVDPEWSRCGIGSVLMARIEARLRRAGHDTALLTATLSGVPLYRHLGYAEGAALRVALGKGLELGALRMSKALTGCKGAGRALVPAG